MASTAPGVTLKSSGTLQKEKTITELWDICIHGAVRADGIVHHKKKNVYIMNIKIYSAENNSLEQ